MGQCGGSVFVRNHTNGSNLSARIACFHECFSSGLSYNTRHLNVMRGVTITTVNVSFVSSHKSPDDVNVLGVAPQLKFSPEFVIFNQFIISLSSFLPPPLDCNIFVIIQESHIRTLTFCK